MKLSRRLNHPAVDLFSEFDHFFNRAFSRSLLPGTRRSNGEFGVYEAKDTWHLRTDLPGFARENIDLRMEEGVLHLSAERDDDGQAFHSRIDRSFQVPDNIDVAGIEAHLANGVLEVILPKLAPAEPEVVRIEVK